MQKEIIFPKTLDLIRTMIATCPNLIRKTNVIYAILPRAMSIGVMSTMLATSAALAGSCLTDTEASAENPGWPFGAKPEKNSNQSACVSDRCLFKFDPNKKDGTRARGDLPGGPSSKINSSFTITANADALKMHVWKLPGFDTTEGRAHSCTGGNKKDCVSIRPVVYDGCVYLYAEGDGVEGGDPSGDGGGKGTYFPKRKKSNGCLHAEVASKISFYAALNGSEKDCLSLKVDEVVVVKEICNLTLTKRPLLFNQQLVHVFAGGKSGTGLASANACLTRPQFSKIKLQSSVDETEKYSVMASLDALP